MITDSKARVLYVDDQELTRILVQKLLTCWGYHCDVDSNPINAIERLKTDFFDMVILDQNMPDLSGYNAANAIRSLHQIVQPIIILTSADDIDDTILLSETRIDGFIRKPITRENLSKYLPSSILTKNQIKNKFGINEDEANQIIELFIQQTEDMIQTLEETLNSQAHSESIRIIHALKGEMSIFMLDSLIELLDALTDQIKENPQSDLNLYIRLLKMGIQEGVGSFNTIATLL